MGEESREVCNWFAIRATNILVAFPKHDKDGVDVCFVCLWDGGEVCCCCWCVEREQGRKRRGWDMEVFERFFLFI